MTGNDLPDYLVWANTRAVEMLQPAPAAAGVEILAHLLAVERVWAERIACAASSASLWPDWTLAECEARIGGNADFYRDILHERTSTEEVHYHNSRGEEFLSRRSDILLHVLAHGAYHRGQISQEVRRSGGEVKDTDYILFARR